MIHRAQDALGLLGARQVEVAVHRTDHQIEPRQHLIRQVEVAVFEDVHLDALEQRDAVQLGVESVDLVALFRQLLRIEAVRDGEAARVFGDREILQSQRLGRQRHVAQAVVAVAGPGVRMQVALQVGQFDQLGQASGARRLDLAAVFAQFGRNVGQADRAVHRFLAVPGDALCAAEHAVFVDLQAELLRDAADRDVVRLGAGEVVQRRAVALLRHDAQVDLHAAFEQHAGARVAGGIYLGHFVIGREALHHRAVRRGSDQDIQVADGLAHAPEAAGDDHLLHAGDRLQKGAQRLRHTAPRWRA